MSFCLSALKNICTVASCGIGQKKLFILIYHRVLNEFDPMNPSEVDKGIFTWQMALLKKYFNVLSLHDGVQALNAGRLPPRAVCITFDDGYADNLLNAVPILSANQLPATFFVASDYLDGGIMWNDRIVETIRRLPQVSLDLSALQLGVYDIKTVQNKSSVASEIVAKVKHLDVSERQACVDYIANLAKVLPTDLMLTTLQLKQLSESGMEVGGHTLSHPILSTLNAEQASHEIEHNKMILEGVLGESVRYFAYPNGKPGQDYLPEQVDMVKQSGYEAAVSTLWGVSNKKTDQWQLARATPWDRTPERFMMRMAAVYSGIQ